MRHRQPRTAVILLVALMAVSLLACRKPFAPQAISADLVPERVRGSLDHENFLDVVWHVSQTDWSGGLSLYAATFTLASPDGAKVPTRIASVWGIQADPQLREGWVTIGIKNDQVFWGQTGGGTGRIEAGGYCFDSHATEVVAKTTEGREFRCPVTNGFWLVVVSDRISQPSPNPLVENWAEITARSSSGKVLHYLDLGRPM